MRKIPRIVFAFLTIFALLLVSSCGDANEKSDFEKKMSTAKLAEFETSLDKKIRECFVEYEKEKTAFCEKNKIRFEFEEGHSWQEGWTGEFAPYERQDFLLENQIPVTLIVTLKELSGEIRTTEKIYFYFAYDTKIDALYVEGGGRCYTTNQEEGNIQTQQSVVSVYDLLYHMYE